MAEPGVLSGVFGGVFGRNVYNFCRLPKRRQGGLVFCKTAKKTKTPKKGTPVCQFDRLGIIFFLGFWLKIGGFKPLKNVRSQTSFFRPPTGGHF